MTVIVTLDDQRRLMTGGRPQVPDLRDLRTTEQLLAECPALRKGTLRDALFHRKMNGLDHAVVRMGRRLLIDVEAFKVWLSSGR